MFYWNKSDWVCLRHTGMMHCSVTIIFLDCLGFVVCISSRMQLNSPKCCRERNRILWKERCVTVLAFWGDPHTISKIFYPLQITLFCPLQIWKNILIDLHKPVPWSFCFLLKQIKFSYMMFWRIVFYIIF